MKFYVSVFPNSRVLSENPRGGGSFELDGQKFIAFNGGPHFKLNPAFSMFVDCETQEEVDTLWEKMLEGGGEESRCGWLVDRFGLSWQIIPKILIELLSSEDPSKAQRALEAMLQMQKIDIATLQRAADG